MYSGYTLRSWTMHMVLLYFKVGMWKRLPTPLPAYLSIRAGLADDTTMRASRFVKHREYRGCEDLRCLYIFFGAYRTYMHSCVQTIDASRTEPSRCVSSLSALCCLCCLSFCLHACLLSCQHVCLSLCSSLSTWFLLVASSQVIYACT